VLKTLSTKTVWTYLWIRYWGISSRSQFYLMPADIIHLNDLLSTSVLVTSYLNFDQFAGSYLLRCALLWSGLAVAVPAAVVGQVGPKHVAASPKVKSATGKSQPCQQPVVVVATRRRAVSAIVIAEMSTNKTTR